MNKQIPKFEELEKITLGQEVIVFDEGAMKLIEIKRKNIEASMCTDPWYNPVFLSKIVEDKNIKYKRVEIIMEYSQPAKKVEIIEKSNQDYSYFNKIWENLK